MIPVCSSKFFRPPVCLAKDNLIVNTGRSSISSIQFQSHKLLQSWTLKQPRSFSCPAVYVPHKNELLCVIDKNVLLVWSYEADSLDEAKETKFHDTIFAIIPVENQQLIVFSSGSCLLLEAALSKFEFIMEPYLSNEENLIWADASSYDQEDSKLFIYLLTSCKDGHKLHSLLLSISSGHVEKLSEQVISRDSASLRSWCMKLEDEQIFFITVWSDGQVHSYSNYGKPPAHLLTIPQIQDKELLAVEALDSCHIVAVRCHPSSGCSYEIWDSRYATKKTHKSIDLAVPENLQVRILDDTLLIPSSQGIVAEPLKVTFPTLSAVVGKSSNTDEVQDIYSWTPDGMLHQEYVEESSSDVSNCRFSTITRKEIFEELLSRLHGQDAETIISCLREIKSISESKLVKLVQYLLRENHSKFSEKSRKRKPSSTKSEKDIIRIFLGIFLIPYNDIYLQQHLRKLTFKEAMAILEILSMLLRDKACVTVHDDCSLFSSIQLLNWACLLLFSHFEEVVLSTEKEMSSVEDLLNVIINKLKKCDKASRIQHKEVDVKSSTTPKYCIECLYL